MTFLYLNLNSNLDNETVMTCTKDKINEKTVLFKIQTIIYLVA